MRKSHKHMSMHFGSTKIIQAMANQVLHEVKHTEGFDVVVEVLTLGIIAAPETTSYVVEDKDSGDKSEFISKSDAINYMSSTNNKC